VGEPSQESANRVNAPGDGEEMPVRSERLHVRDCEEGQRCDRGKFKETTQTDLFFAMPFDTKSDHFAKTGSGQT
jgi:hypothetical protein